MNLKVVIRVAHVLCCGDTDPFSLNYQSSQAHNFRGTYLLIKLKVGTRHY
jgi:hypothetical protein